MSEAEVALGASTSTPDYELLLEKDEVSLDGLLTFNVDYGSLKLLLGAVLKNLKRFRDTAEKTDKKLADLEHQISQQDGRLSSQEERIERAVTPPTKEAPSDAETTGTLGAEKAAEEAESGGKKEESGGKEEESGGKKEDSGGKEEESGRNGEEGKGNLEDLSGKVERLIHVPEELKTLRDELEEMKERVRILEDAQEKDRSGGYDDGLKELVEYNMQRVRDLEAQSGLSRDENDRPYSVIDEELESRGIPSRGMMGMTPGESSGFPGSEHLGSADHGPPAGTSGAAGRRRTRGSKELLSTPRSTGRPPSGESDGAKHTNEVSETKQSGDVVEQADQNDGTKQAGERGDDGKGESYGGVGRSNSALKGSQHGSGKLLTEGEGSGKVDDSNETPERSGPTSPDNGAMVGKYRTLSPDLVRSPGMQALSALSRLRQEKVSIFNKERDHLRSLIDRQGERIKFLEGMLLRKKKEEMAGRIAEAPVDVEGRLAKVEDEASSLQHIIIELRGQLDSLDNEIRRKKNRASMPFIPPHTSTDEREKQQGTDDTGESRMGLLEQDVESLRDTSKGLQGEVNALRGELEALAAAGGTSQPTPQPQQLGPPQEEQKRKDSSSGQAVDINPLKLKISALEDAVNILNGKLKDLGEQGKRRASEQAATAPTSNNDEYQEEFKDMHAKLSDLQGNIDSSLQDMDSRLSMLEGRRVSIPDTVNNAVRHELNKLLGLFDNLKGEVEEQGKALDKRGQEAKMLTIRVDSLENREPAAPITQPDGTVVVDHSGDIRALRDQLSALMQMVEEAANGAQEALRDVKSLRGDVGQLDKDVKANAEAAEERMTSLAESLGDVTNEAKRLDHVKANQKDLEQVADHLGAGLASVMERLQGLEAKGVSGVAATAVHTAPGGRSGCGLNKDEMDSLQARVHTHASRLDGLQSDKANRDTVLRLQHDIQDLKKLVIDLQAAPKTGRQGGGSGSQRPSVDLSILKDLIDRVGALEGWKEDRDSWVRVQLGDIHNNIDALLLNKADAIVVAAKAERDYVENAMEKLRKEVEQVMNNTNKGLIETLDRSLNILRQMIDGKANAMDMNRLKELLLSRNADDGTPEGLLGFKQYRCLSCNRRMDGMRPRPMGMNFTNFMSHLPGNPSRIKSQKKVGDVSPTAETARLITSAHHRPHTAGGEATAIEGGGAAMLEAPR